LYKKKFLDLQSHCVELERKVENVFLNQNYFEEIVEDFIKFKKLSDVCAERGGYYDPSNLKLSNFTIDVPMRRFEDKINVKVINNKVSCHNI